MVRQVKDLPCIRMAEPFGTVRQNAGLCVAFISSYSAYYATAMKKTTAVFLKPGAQWDYSKGVREQAHWDEHARFIDDLFARGVILMVGPFTPEGTGALAILNVDTAAAPRAIYAKYPWAHEQALVTDEAREWTIFLDSRDES